MVSAAKAFAKEPPRETLDNLDAIVRDFQWRYVDRKKTDQVIAFCGEAPDLPTAVRRAVEARDANGKHHNHQSKVNIDARRLFGRRIVRAAQAGRIPLDDFDAMHDWMDDHKPVGIGPVTVYDTAVRVAAFVGIEPKSVYMHAGVQQGFRTLLGAMTWCTMTSARYQAQDFKRVDVGLFPPPLCHMKADDVEDILCTYREVFESWT
jgi:hypothetical protein